MRSFLENHLNITFPPREKPGDIAINVYEIENIHDRDEGEILPGMFWRDAFRWLTVEGFHYYFPRLIRNSLIDLEASLMVIEQNWEDLVADDSYRRVFLIDEKWNRFSVSQLQYVLKWNEWILTERPFYTQDADVQKFVRKVKAQMLAKKSRVGL